MCGLFGVMNYGKKPVRFLMDLVEDLGEASMVRGRDATGIAYVDKHRVAVKKSPVSAWGFKFYDAPKGLTHIMGHTRRTTKGDAKFNYNNHPFLGKAGKDNFALAHNGVLDNDLELRKQYKLPETKIMTDSYIAVQMLETRDQLDMEAIKFMAERIEGAFTLTILDDYKNLCVIKNDSPFCMVHIPDLELYAYASTDKILFEALIKYDLTRDYVIDSFRYQDPTMLEVIEPEKGDILIITADGEQVWDKYSPRLRRSSKNKHLDAIALGTSDTTYSSAINQTTSMFNQGAGTAGNSYVPSKGGELVLYQQFEEGYVTQSGVVNRLGDSKYDTPADSRFSYIESIIQQARAYGLDETDVEVLFEYGYGMADIEEGLWNHSLWDMVERAKAALLT